MARLLLSRLVQLPLIVGVVFLATFALLWLVPTDPLGLQEGRGAPPEVVAAARAQYHLDEPVTFIVEYAKGAVLGTPEGGWPDLGPSFTSGGSRVRDILMAGLPVSVTIGAIGLVLALLIGTAAGVIGALRPGSPLDFASLAAAVIGISLPSFVTGSAILVLFVGGSRWLFPGTPGVHWPFAEGGTGWGEYALPALTLSLAPAAYIARLVRLGLADTMSSDFIRTARAKGLSRHAALFRHALKVAYLPVLSFLGPAAAAALTGSFVVEKIFALPGLGRYFVDAVLKGDRFLVLGVVLVYAVMLILFNLLVDLAYAWLDPRISV